MVSKNNQQWKRQQEAQRVPHYGLRKLSVGVASVLLSTTLYMGVTAHADTIAGTSQQLTAVQPASTGGGASTGNGTLNGNVTSDEQPMADQPVSNGANISTGNATTDVQLATGQPASKVTNSTVPENDVNAKVEPIFLPKPSSSERYVQPTAETNEIQPFMNLAVKPEQPNVQPSGSSVDSPETVKPATAWQPEPTTNYSADHTAKIDMTNQPTIVQGDNWKMSLDKNYIKAGQDATLTVSYEAQAGDTFVLDVGYPANSVNAQLLSSQIGTTSTKNNGLRTQVTNVFKEAGTYTQVINLNGWKKSAESLKSLRKVFGDQAFDLTLKRGTSVENVQAVGRLYLTSNFTPTMNGTGSVGVDGIDPKYVPVLSTNNNYIFSVRTNWSDSGTVLNPSYNGDFVYSISVPKTFELDQAATEAFYQQIRSNELYWRWGNRGSNVTVSQAGVGAPVIVKANALDWIGWHYGGNDGVSFLGHFVDAPSVATTLTAEGQTSVSDTIGGHTQTVTLPGLSAKVINAADYNYADSGSTVSLVSDYGDDNQLYQSHEVPMTGNGNSIRLIHNLSLVNNSPFDVKNATVTLTFGDGLHVDVGSVRSNAYISNLLADNNTAPNREKSFLVTYQDGTSDMVPFNFKGDPTKNIKSITLTRDWNAGQMAGMHGGGIHGFVASTYQDGSPVKVGDAIKVSLTVAGVNTAGHNVSKTVFDTLKVVDQQFAPLTTENFWGGVDKTGLGDNPSGTINMHWNRTSGERGKIQLENPTIYFVMPNTVAEVKNPRWGVQKDAPGHAVPTLTSITYAKSKDGESTVAIMHFSGLLIDQAPNNSVPLYFDTVNKDNVVNQTTKGYVYWTADNVNADGLTKVDTSRLDSQNKSARLPADLSPEQLSKIYFHAMYLGKIDMATGIYSTSATKTATTPWRAQTIMDYHGDGQADVGVNLVNDTSNELHNVVAIINVSKASNNSNLTVNLTGNNVELIDPNTNSKLTDGVTVLYSTKSADLSLNDLSSFVTADQVADWSKVQAVAVTLQTLGGMTSRQVQIPVVVNDLMANVGKTGTVGTRVSADELKPIIVSVDAENAAKLVVGGQATIRAQMHYQDAQGQDHYVPLADSTHAYDILQSRVLNSSDFTPSATDLAQLPGYELSKASPTIVSGNAVIGQPVSAQDDGSVLQFELVPSVQKVLINYVDDEQGEKVVGTGTVSGKTGTEVTITPQLPNGYMLTPDKDVPSTYTVTDDANQAVTIHVQKQFVDLSDTDPQAKQTRTITLHYVYDGGSKDGQPAFDDAVLDVYYHRTATLDRATNQTTYGDWMWDQSQGDPSTPGYHVVSGKWTNLPQSWATVTADVPNIKGYSVDLGQNDPANTNHVPANTWVFPTYNNSLGGGMSDNYKGSTAYLDGYGYEVSPTHTVKYMPNKTTVTVNYVDDDNNKAVVGSQHWDGTTGQHIDLTLTPPDNYVLTPGWVNPTSYDFDGTNSSWYTVHVKHKTQDVTDQEPKDQVTKVTQLTRNYLYGDGPHKGKKFAEPDIFDVAWKRTATKDLVTDKVTFGNWQVNWDDSKSVQGRLTAQPTPYMQIDGMMYPGKNGYSIIGNNAHSEFVRADGSVVVNGRIKYGWGGTAEIESYPVLNYYYGPGQVKIPVQYVDADTGQKVAERINDDALTGDDFRDGNTVTIDQSKLISLPTTLTGYQLLPGQTLPTSYKIDTFAGVKAIEVQVVKDRSVKVTFVDDDAGGDIVGTPTTITGHTGGDPVALDLTVPDKYQLANGQQLPISYTFTKGSGDVTIHLKHQVVQREATTNVYMFEIPYIKGFQQSLEWILPKDQWNLVGEDKYGHPENINALRKKLGTISGHVNYDLVTNRVTSVVDDWTSLNLQDQTFSVPTTDAVVNGVMTGDDEITGKTISEYMKEKQWGGFFADDLKYPLKAYLSQQLTATEGGSAFYRVIVPELVPGGSNRFANERGDTTGSAFKLTEPINRSYLEKYQRSFDWKNGDSSDFRDQNGQLVSDSLLRVSYVYVPYIEKAVTRTINVVKPDGTKQQVVQTATLDKAVSLSTVDKLNWSTSEWASYEVPTIPGYTASQSNVAKETVTDTTEDQTVDITYTANDQQMTITFYDQDGKKVTDKVIKGTTGSTIPVGDLIPDGWELYDGQNVPKDITFKAHNDNQDFVIKHVLSLVSADNIPEAGSVIKGTKAKTYPEGLTMDMLTKTITRIIRVMKDGHQVGIKTQRVTFLRNAVVDAVTGSVKTLSWSEDGSHVFTAYQPASIECYTVDGVKAMTVSPLNEPSTTVIVNYKAVPQALNVIYQTADGQQVGSTVSMVADKDGQIDLISQLPSGYELATPVQKTNVSDLHVNNYYVTVKPRLKVYTSEDTDIPSGVHLTKAVNRTINITLPNGKRKTINQTVYFNRMVTIDANGNSTYTDWKAVGTDTFDGVRLPVRHGYKLVFDDGSNGIKAQQVTNAETANDVVINVSYVKA